MKKVLTFFLLLTAAVSFSQSYYPEKKPTLLIGHKIRTYSYTPEELKKKESHGDDGFDCFYSDSIGTQVYKRSGRRTPYKVLMGRTFTITGMKVVNSLPNIDIYLYKLEDGKETIYFKETFGKPFDILDFVPEPEYWDLYLSEVSGATSGRVTLYAEKRNVFTITKTLSDTKPIAKIDHKVHMSFITPGSGEGSPDPLYLAFTLENGETLVIKNSAITGLSYNHNDYDTSVDLEPGELDKLSQFRVTEVHLGKNCVRKYKYGLELMNVLARVKIYKPKSGN